MHVLRGDIRKFFASVDHKIMLRLLERRVVDKRLLEVIAIMLGSYHSAPIAAGGNLSLDEPRPVGLPIGSLTSQLFANIYLNEVDQFVKHALRERYYLRYMDDFLIIHSSKRHLHKVKHDLLAFASDNLALELHPVKTKVVKFTGSVRFPCIYYSCRREATIERLIVFRKAYEYLFWLRPTVERFTRVHKYSLGNDLQASGLRLLQLIIRANYATDKRNFIGEAITEYEIQRIFIRLAIDYKLLSDKQFTFASSRLEEIARL